MLHRKPIEFICSKLLSFQFSFRNISASSAQPGDFYMKFLEYDERLLTKNLVCLNNLFYKFWLKA